MSPDKPFALNDFLVEAGLQPLDSRHSAAFKAYLGLILRWNQRINLTSIRDEEGILRRHLVESIACAQSLPVEIGNLLDFGSGAGLPGIPIALCRPEIMVTLAESQNKKAAFLREALRVLGVSANVHAGRAETLRSHFDCVVLRAVDHMEIVIKAGAKLAVPGGWLAVFTTTRDLRRLLDPVAESFARARVIPLPFSEDRILALSQRS